VTTIGNTADPNDPWALATNGYDVDKFYIRSTDGKGHGEVLHVKVSPAIHSVVQEMIADRNLGPYRSVHDVIRDALVHRLRYIADQKGLDNLEREVTGEAQLARMEMWRRQRDARTHFITEFRERMRELERDDDTSHMIDAIEDARPLVEAWDDSRHGSELAEVLDRYEWCERRANVRAI
jgi:hypothetical protein